MAVRIVTDSTADIPAEVAKKLGITVVPLAVHFGETTYLDGVDLKAEEFFDKLKCCQRLPTTSQPPPESFARAYDDLSREASDIVSIHISAKLSGTCNSAVLGRTEAGNGCRIEVVDSLQASMALGLIVIQAARTAAQGAKLDEVLESVRSAISGVHFFGMVDTLEYLHKGGRIGKAQSLLGTLLRIKPLVGIKDGEAYPVGRARSHRAALERLAGMVRDFKQIKELAIVHSTTDEEARSFLERLAPAFPIERAYLSSCGPVIGAYMGPGSIGVALMEG